MEKKSPQSLADMIAETIDIAMEDQWLMKPEPRRRNFVLNALETAQWWAIKAEENMTCSENIIAVSKSLSSSKYDGIAACIYDNKSAAYLFYGCLLEANKKIKQELRTIHYDFALRCSYCLSDALGMLSRITDEQGEP